MVPTAATICVDELYGIGGTKQAAASSTRLLGWWGVSWWGGQAAGARLEVASI